MEEMIIKNKNDEEYLKNEYKYRLILEFKETIEKRVKLGKYLSEIANKTMNEKEREKRELLDKQFQILNNYEEILYNRLILELTTN